MTTATEPVCKAIHEGLGLKKVESIHREVDFYSHPASAESGGDKWTAYFRGPGSSKRAEEYAAWKNGETK